MIKFILEGEEKALAMLWMANQIEKEPTLPTAIGGRFSYRFTPTGIGTAVVVIDAQTKEEENVTDYGGW